MSALQLHEAELDQADDAAHEEANVGALMQMLRRDGEAQADGAGGPPVGGGDREGGGGGGGAEDEEAAERAAAMEALAALDDEETDSDDDEKGRKEYVEPPIKFMREIREVRRMHFVGVPAGRINDGGRGGCGWWSGARPVSPAHAAGLSAQPLAQAHRAWPKHTAAGPSTPRLLPALSVRRCTPRCHS